MDWPTWESITPSYDDLKPKTQTWESITPDLAREGIANCRAAQILCELKADIQVASKYSHEQLDAYAQQV